MPNDDSTPQMFENRNGLSSVTTASVQTASFALERQVHFVGLDVARQPDVPIDRRRARTAAGSAAAAPRGTA